MTNLDDLKLAWQSQSGITQERFEQLGTKVRGSSDILRTRIFHRDMAETFAALFVVCFFGAAFFQSKHLMVRTGIAVIVIDACIIQIVLWWGRKRPALNISSASFREFIDVEIDFLRRQIWLLRKIAWWYLLPLYVGMTFFVLGMDSPYRDASKDLNIVKCVFIPIVTALCIYGWWMNQKACKQYLEPLFTYYVDLRAGLDRDDDSVMRLSDAPTEFLHSTQRSPISRLRRSIGMALTVACTIAVVAFGNYTMTNFDARTGKFIIGCAPVIGILVIVVTGVWRRNPKPPSIPEL